MIKATPAYNQIHGFDSKYREIQDTYASHERTNALFGRIYDNSTIRQFLVEHSMVESFRSNIR